MMGFFSEPFVTIVSKNMMIEKTEGEKNDAHE